MSMLKEPGSSDAILCMGGYLSAHIRWLIPATVIMHLLMSSSEENGIYGSIMCRSSDEWCVS